MNKKLNQYPLIFVHVFRSGGMSLNKALENNFPASKKFQFYVEEAEGISLAAVERFEKLTLHEKKQFLFLGGHVDFGLHHYYDEFTYVTIFRNPIERILSYYKLILADKYNYLHKSVINNRMKIEDIINNKMSVEFDNSQVRQISGIKGVKFGECNEYILEKAIENLDKYFPIFGITERYNESLILIKNYFDFPLPFYRPVNIGKNKNPFTLSPESVDFIKKTNYLDMKFYEYANKKFHESIDKSDGFEKQLKNFNNQNSMIKKFKIGNIYYGLSAWQLYTKCKAYFKWR